MSDPKYKKVCPFMTRPVVLEHTGAVMQYQGCMQEECMAWSTRAVVERGEYTEEGYCQLIGVVRQ